jgi:threonine dehydratase
VFAVTIPEERGSFRRFCATLGYPWVDESAHPAYRLLLRS